MTRLRTRLSRFVPRGVAPAAKRGLRQLDRLRGLPHAQARPGVLLMLHVGRCGSTVLADLLKQDPRIHWDAKLPRIAKGLYGARLAEMDFPKWVSRQFAISGAGFYGFEFKILDDQYPALIGMPTAEFLNACQEIGVTHFILLTRKNTLRHVVSHYASRHRGSWHATVPGAVTKKSFHLDVGDITTGSEAGRPLVDYMREVDAAHSEVRAALAEQHLLEIEYESDINDKGARHAYGMICAFLGLSPSEVHIRNVKMNPYPLESVLENYDEVAATLEGTEYEWMVKD